MKPIFDTPHNQAFEKLGAIPPGQHWGAFDVLKSDATVGLAKRFVTTVWNFHSEKDEKGRRTPTERALSRDSNDGTLWYQFKKPPKGCTRTTWLAHWDSLRLAHDLRIPIVGVLKDVDTGNCSIRHVFDCGPFRGDFEDDYIWMRLTLRGEAEDEADLEEFINSFSTTSPDGYASGALASALSELESEGYFSPSDMKDERQKRLREIVQRRGQQEFRQQLLIAYKGSCAVTGCDAIPALEAAHLVPYCGPKSNHTTNGLLLRSDIHTLFDLGLLVINPETLTIVLAPPLLQTSYAELEGRRISMPAQTSCHPNPEALAQRWKDFNKPC